MFTIGGAQAVGALAYGTADHSGGRQDRGPGNAYVAAAKRRVFGTVGIDMIAGPSEILVLVRRHHRPATGSRWTCSRRPSTTSWRKPSCCARDDALHRARAASIDRLLPTMPRQDVIRASLEGRGALIQRARHGGGLRDRQRHRARAPRNLRARAASLGPLIRHAGAIFLGRYTSESLGDYCAGPNHVLPTSRTARFSSPLGVYDFQKRSSVIEVSEAGAQTLGEIAAELAYGEGLQAHARSAEYRMRQNNNDRGKQHTARHGREAGCQRAGARKLRRRIVRAHCPVITTIETNGGP